MFSLPSRRPAGPQLHRGAGPPRHSTRWTPPPIVDPELRMLWREACQAIPGAHQEIPTVTGVTITTPPIVGMSAGRLVVQLLPGQLVEDLQEAAPRLAGHLGAVKLRIRPLGLTQAVIELLDSDPLAEVVAPVAPVASALDPVVLGVDEDGDPVTLELGSAAHLIVQGTTGGGKSVGCYSLLGQLAKAPDVRVTGVDPTGLLLRPWVGRWLDLPAPALGTADPMIYVLTLDQVVREMDRRIVNMPARRDSVRLGPDCPVLIVVLEEYPAQLRILDTADAKLGKQYRALVGRLLAEGRKGGVRVLLITQRADASIVGAYERGQASHRISYRLDSADGVRMLHPDATPELAAEHASAPAGVALVTVPGRPLTRIRSPYVSYPDYCDAVSSPSLRVVA